MTFWSAIQNTFIALDSGLVQLLRSCMTSDTLFHFSRPQLPQVYVVGRGGWGGQWGSGRHDWSSPLTPLLRPFSVLGRGKNVALEWTGQ